ncbi:hypothetical protein FQZ97_1106620 [compost metagenome]
MFTSVFQGQEVATRGMPQVQLQGLVAHIRGFGAHAEQVGVILGLGSTGKESTAE